MRQWRYGIAVLVLCGATVVFAGTAIDRRALVTRHNVVLTNVDTLATLQVGNGEFAFAVDVTGLQTFPDAYREGIQLGTQAQWGWETAPNPSRFTIDEVLSPYDAHGRRVLYADGQRQAERAKHAYAWLRENPHRTQLGRLYLTGITQLSDVKNIRQTLDLWAGKIDSRFEYDGQPVHVETVVHPDRDIVAVRVESGRVGVEFACGGGVAVLKRWPTATNVVEVTLAFAREKIAEAGLPGFVEVRDAAAKHWEQFWSTGGAVDLSGSHDPRWRELERRIVLSQYLTAIQCAGSMPPQETGLVQNSWYGKFHLEMHWWHAAHFALWGRPELLERSLGWYTRILPVARALARRNGYAGARWPKMVGPDGEDSPSPIGGFLIWQQPHPIYYAELLYRAQPGKATLEKYRELVMATAEFIASYAVWDESAKSLVLGPPLIPAQESYGPLRATVINPTYELAYWYWGLQTAQQWRERLGLPRDSRWDEVCRGLAKPCVREGRYAAIAVEPFTLTHDHPSMLQAYGFLPATPLIDPATMNRTLDFVLKNWDWKTTWGWDYPVVAMTATRLGRAEDAVNALLLDTPKNRYLPNGHNYQRPGLPLYLPGNGGLLAAIALMATSHGFPENGQWNVRWEGLQRLP